MKDKTTKFIKELFQLLMILVIIIGIVSAIMYAPILLLPIIFPKGYVFATYIPAYVVSLIIGWYILNLFFYILKRLKYFDIDMVMELRDDEDNY